MYLTKIVLSTIVALALFVGGIIILLFSKIPFWSVLLGTGASQIGIIALILTFERLSRETTADDAEIDKQLQELQMSETQHLKTKSRKLKSYV